MSWNRRKPNEKCIECSKINWKFKSNYTNMPSCYNRDRCKRKKAYYRRHEYYKAKARENHKYIRFCGKNCLLCGSTEKLEVHHIIPQCKGGTDDWTNIVTLCPTCHNIISKYYSSVGWESKFCELPQMVSNPATIPSNFNDTPTNG